MEYKEEKVKKINKQNRVEISDNCYVTFCWPPVED